MLFSKDNSDNISPKNDTFDSEGVENWENSKEEEVEITRNFIDSVIDSRLNESKFKETFPKIEDLKNAWKRADDSKKEEIAALAGSSDWSEILNIYRNS